MKPLGKTKNSFEIYTDGGCLPNKQGSWAYLIVANEVIQNEESGFVPVTTALRMEFLAVINALERLPPRTRAQVFTDSLILVETMTRDIHKWKTDRWTRKSGRPILNPDLILKLDQLSRQLDIQWTWLRGHAGHKFNERCDDLCRHELGKLYKPEVV